MTRNAAGPVLRPERPSDGDAIRAVTAAAFHGHPHSAGTEPRIVDALRAAGALALSLVAIDEAGHVTGHVALSPVLIDGADLGWLGLGPVSVHPDRQGKGIGGALIRAAIAHLHQGSAGGCVVLGEPQLYRPFGFGPAGGLVYPGFATELFQRLDLGDAAASRAAAGIVSYHPAFDVI